MSKACRRRFSALYRYTHNIMINSGDNKSLVMSGFAAIATHAIIAAVALAFLFIAFKAPHTDVVFLVGPEPDGKRQVAATQPDLRAARAPSARHAVSQLPLKTKAPPVMEKVDKIAESPKPEVVISGNEPRAFQSKDAVTKRDQAKTVQFATPNAPDWLHMVKPVYPFMARRMNKEGKVLLRVSIDEKGILRNVEVVEPAGFGFTEAALDAVKKSTYKPARKNGYSASSLALLPIRFRLTDQ
jgi:TonB family protein